MEQKSLYDILKIPADASAEIIKSSYFNLLTEMTSSVDGKYKIEDIQNINVAFRYLIVPALRYIYDTDFDRESGSELSHYKYDDLKDLKMYDDQDIIELLEQRIDLYKSLLDSKIVQQVLDYEKLETIIQELENNKILLKGEYLNTWYKK